MNDQNLRLMTALGQINEKYIKESERTMSRTVIIKAAVAEKAIPACNITYIDGEEMKEALLGYLEILFELNPKAVGGKLPGEDFYLDL